MKSVVLFFALGIVSLSSSLFAQDKQTMARLINTDNLKNNLYILAGAEMEGRETGTRGQIRAAGFIADYYKQIGLAPGNNNGSYFQNYPLIKDSVEYSMIKVNGQEFKYHADFTFPLTLNKQEKLTASEVIWGGYGITDSLFNNLAGIDARGKILLVLGGAPSTHGLSRWANFSAGAKLRAVAAAKAGAKAVFIIDSTFSAAQNKFAGSISIRPAKESRTAKAVTNVYMISPAIAKAIAGDQYEYLIRKVGQVIPVDFHKTLPISVVQQMHHEILQSSNVLGYLPGTDKKEELLIVSAHYDHLGIREGKIYFGADDNASGTASVLELARIFTKAKAAGKGPRRSILFLNVSGEEEGLWGSDYYTSHPVYPLGNTVADLNTDMIGRVDTLHTPIDSNYIYIIGDNKLSSALRPINENNNNAFTKLKLDYKYNDPLDPEKIYYRSDHYNFAKNNIPILFFFDGINEDYHKFTDTADKINYELMTNRLGLVFDDAWDIANREERLPVDRHEK